MKYKHFRFSLSLRAQQVLRLCLFLCLIHALLTLSSTVSGFVSGSPIAFAHNIEALKSLILCLSLTVLYTGLTEKAFRSS